MSQSRTRITATQKLVVNQALEYAKTNPISVEQLIKVIQFLTKHYNNEEDGKHHVH